MWAENVVVQAIRILQTSDGSVLHLSAGCNTNPGYMIEGRECNSVQRGGFRAPGKWQSQQRHHHQRSFGTPDTSSRAIDGTAKDYRRPTAGRGTAPHQQ